MNVFIGWIKCSIYGIIGITIIVSIYELKKKKTRQEIIKDLLYGILPGILIGTILWGIAAFSAIETSELREDKQILSENKLINLKLVTGTSANYYMVLGSGGGTSETDFTYFYYIEEDGKYKPKKISLLSTSICPQDSNEEPKIQKIQVKKSNWIKEDNGFFANILNIDISTDYKEESIFFDSNYSVKEETIFYISKDKISNEIDPNIR